MMDTLYRADERFLHYADVRIKMIMLPYLTVLFLLPAPLYFEGILFGAVFCLSAAAIGGKAALAPLKALLPLFVLVVLLTPPFHREGPVLLARGSFVILSLSGALTALRYLLRFAGITLLFALFFATTSMDDFLLALRWYGLPFSWALVVSLSLRQIPHLVGVYGNIRMAHRLRRSAQTPRGGLRARVKRLIPVLVSLVIVAVKGIPALAMALELKGVTYQKQRSTFRRLPPPRRPLLQLFITALIIAMSLLFLLLSP